MSNSSVVGNFTININFNLRKTEPLNQLTAINAVVRFNNQRIVVSGIDKVEPRYWNAEKQAPRQHAANPKAREISRNLNDAKARITEAFEAHVKKHNSYPSDLKSFLSTCKVVVFGVIDPGGQTKAPIKRLTPYIEQFIKDIEDGKRIITNGPSKGMQYSKNTLKTYSNLLFNLKGFANYCGPSKEFEFNDIDLDFYNQFREYLVVSRNLSPGYFGDMIKAIKSIMSDAFEKGYHTNLKFKGKHFIKETVEPDTVYLNIKKLRKLLEYDFGKKDYLDKARNLFLVGCFSGLRYSDFSNLKPENISGDFLRIRAQKTKDHISIPISRDLREILDRYKDGKIQSITNQKLNEYIKEACRIIGETDKESGFTELVSVKKYEKGKLVYVNIPFYSLVSSHTARRSWATNAFRAGYPTFLISAITGHKQDKTLYRYLRLDNDDKSVLMLEMMRRNELKLVND